MACAASLSARPSSRELAHGVRQEIDADAERMDLGRGLEHAARDAGLVAAQRQRQPADAAADDQDVGRREAGAHSGWIPRLGHDVGPARAVARPRSRPSAAGVEVAGTRPCASNTFLASALSEDRRDLAGSAASTIVGRRALGREQAVPHVDVGALQARPRSGSARRAAAAGAWGCRRRSPSACRRWMCWAETWTGRNM